jgi:hypothetical protein
MRRTEDSYRLGLSDSEAEKIGQFKDLLQLLELERRKLATAKVPEGVQFAFGALMKHLNRLSKADILALYETSVGKSHKQAALKLPPAEELSGMSLETIEELISHEDTPRRLLEEIAVVRFHFPRGSLRSLANIKLLRDKIDTRIRNERAHLTISSAAQRAK